MLDAQKKMEQDLSNLEEDPCQEEEDMKRVKDLMARVGHTEEELKD